MSERPRAASERVLSGCPVQLGCPMPLSVSKNDDVGGLMYLSRMSIKTKSSTEGLDQALTKPSYNSLLNISGRSETLSDILGKEDAPQNSGLSSLSLLPTLSASMSWL